MQICDDSIEVDTAKYLSSISIRYRWKGIKPRSNASVAIFYKIFALHIASVGTFTIPIRYLLSLPLTNLLLLFRFVCFCASLCFCFLISSFVVGHFFFLLRFTMPASISNSYCFRKTNIVIKMIRKLSFALFLIILIQYFFPLAWNSIRLRSPAAVVLFTLI